MVKIKMSECLKERLKSMGNDKVAKLILSLSTNGTADDTVKNNYPDYLDFDGNLVTYINSNTAKMNGVKQPWIVNTRQSTKMVRVLRRILKNNVVEEKVNNQDVEQFVANWSASLENTCTIEIVRGWDILDAFNFRGDIDKTKFQMSCANFKQPNAASEPKVKWFYFYIYNENISVAVLKENGKIRGRSVLYSGEQQETYGDFKKGEYYTFMNGIYCEGNGKYRSMLQNWGRERGYIENRSNIPYLGDKRLKGSLCIPIKTHYKTLPPVDYTYMDVDKGLLVTTLQGNGYDTMPEGYPLTNSVKKCYKLAQNGGKHVEKNV